MQLEEEEEEEEKDEDDDDDDEDNDYNDGEDDDDGWPIFKPITYMVIVLDCIFINGSNILFMDGLGLCFVPIG